MKTNSYHQLLKKCDVKAIFLITSGEQMNNNYGPCFNKINFLLPSYVELPWDE